MNHHGDREQIVCRGAGRGARGGRPASWLWAHGPRRRALFEVVPYHPDPVPNGLYCGVVRAEVGQQPFLLDEEGQEELIFHRGGGRAPGGLTPRPGRQTRGHPTLPASSRGRYSATVPGRRGVGCRLLKCHARRGRLELKAGPVPEIGPPEGQRRSGGRELRKGGTRCDPPRARHQRQGVNHLAARGLVCCRHSRRAHTRSPSVDELPGHWRLRVTRRQNNCRSGRVENLNRTCRR
jgi:hypothetical protein